MKRELLKKALFLCAFVFFCLLFSKAAKASEEIYFDDEGNLIYITYDKKATTTTSYKAIGWILKRYDAPINTPGQQYVIVRKIEYAIEDKDNPGYLYCYFWSDKDEILNAVEAVSKDWRKQLETYGDMVYIDSVMTVCKRGVPLGNVDKNGICTGEVYYTLEGIQSARPWANKKYLTAYYDLKLRFPILTEVPKLTYDVSGSKNVEYISSSMSLLKVNSDEYDVGVAIPSGENINFWGGCDSYQYKVKYAINTCTVYVPVEVKTDYVIKWVDLDGQTQTENRTISRWYIIPKNVKYTSIKSLDVYDLEEVKVDSEVIDTTTLYENSDTHVIYSDIRYGQVPERLLVNSYSCYAGKINLSSKDFRKPAIPETNYYDMAKDATSSFMIKSDYLSIGGKVLLSNKFQVSNGAEFVPSACGKSELCKENVTTLDGVSNGFHRDFTLTCVYSTKNKDKRKTVVNKNINGVNIHTPVVAQANIRGEKNVNQAKNPESNDLVLGGEFYVYIDNFGSHNKVRGYGIRDYSKFVGNNYIRFPFKVWFHGNLYEALEWVPIGRGIATFMLPEDVNVGQYEIECLSVATNGTPFLPYNESYNKDISEYGAYGTSKVNVIGRLYDFQVENEKIYVAGPKDRDGQEVLSLEDKEFMPVSYLNSEKLNYNISVTTLGDVADKDKVCGKIVFYYINDSKEYVLVDLYEENAGKLVKCNDSFEMRGEKLGENKYQWSYDYCLPHNFIAVDKDAKLTDMQSHLIRGKNIFIAFEFTLESAESKNLLYVNGENSLKGYCNMWKTQGGVISIPLYNEQCLIKDGTAFMTQVSEKTKYDYEVNGTH